MKRKIISIDENRCTGCGLCIPDCPEGALQIIGGKARLVSDLFCDGLGACIGICPEGAISVIEREAEDYNEKTVMETIVRQGPAVNRAHLEHLLGHGQMDLYDEAIAFMKEHSIAVTGHDKPVCHQKSPHASYTPFTPARDLQQGALPEKPLPSTGSNLRKPHPSFGSGRSSSNS